MLTYKEAFFKGNPALIPLAIAGAVIFAPIFAFQLVFGLPPLVWTLTKLLSIMVAFVFALVSCFEAFHATTELDNRVMYSAGLVMLVAGGLCSLLMLALFRGYVL